MKSLTAQAEGPIKTCYGEHLDYINYDRTEKFNVTNV